MAGLGCERLVGTHSGHFQLHNVRCGLDPFNRRLPISGPSLPFMEKTISRDLGRPPILSKLTAIHICSLSIALASLSLPQKSGPSVFYPGTSPGPMPSSVQNNTRTSSIIHHTKPYPFFSTHRNLQSVSNPTKTHHSKFVPSPATL